MKWFLYILFPPYGMYVFLFKSKVRWFIKTPVTILFILILTLAIDQALNPHRVEDDLSEELIEKELAEKGVWDVERLGAFPYADETHVIYRTATNEGLYHVVITSEQQKTFHVKAIYEVSPKKTFIQNEADFKNPPIVHLALYESGSDYGEITMDEDGMIDSAKGKISTTILNQQTVHVYDEDGKEIEVIEVGTMLPIKVVEYFEKNEDEIGKIQHILDYAISNGFESFYLQTNKGVYRIDRYANDDINLLEATLEST